MGDLDTASLFFSLPDGIFISSGQYTELCVKVQGLVELELELAWSAY